MGLSDSVDANSAIHPAAPELLHIFLQVDRESGSDEVHEQSLRGVRKAQIKLATFYLSTGATDHRSACIRRDEVQALLGAHPEGGVDGR